MDIRTRILLEEEHARRRQGGDRSTSADNARSESRHRSVAPTSLPPPEPPGRAVDGLAIPTPSSITDAISRPSRADLKTGN